MAFARMILAALIATSLALVPIGGTAASSSITSVEMVMADQADMPCCPCCDTQGDFKATACVLKCVALAAAVLPAMTVALPYDPDGLSLRTLVDHKLHGLARAPPTHPPPA
jgi:hypothetical protein